jgi:hypothetical protein
MIKSIFSGDKASPEQLARQIVLKALEDRKHEVLLGLNNHDAKMTDKEKARLQKAYEKQVGRVWQVVGKEWINDQDIY